MRQILVCLGLLLASWAYVSTARAEACQACQTFETLKIGNGSQPFNEILEKLKSRPNAMITLNSGAFCEKGAGASVATDLVRASDEQFAQAEKIARKIEQCPQSCAPKLNEAEFCGYGRSLVGDRYRLGAVGLRLSELTHVYERAARNGQLPIEVLSADMTLYGNEALAVLRRAQSALASGDPGKLPDTDWDASATETAGLFDAVTLLADFALIGGDTAQIETALDKAATEINTLRNDLHVALNRAKLLEPTEELAIEQRILTGASELAYVIASLEASAAAARADADTRMSTDANSVPPGDDPNAIQAAVGCFNQLSLSAMTGSEAPGMVDEMLSQCRSFEGCNDKSPLTLPANISPLRAFIQSREEANKQTLALVNSICSAN